MANNNVSDKAIRLLKIALEYYGKEIGLQSNQYFGMEQVCDEEKEEQSETNYHLQYGFPQSGCVSMDFSYLSQKNSFAINGITVYAPPAGENMFLANFAPETQIGEISIHANFGVDMGTEEHKTVREIEENPNAVKMLDLAIADLSRAEILDECMTVVSDDSERIPCCTSRHISNIKGRGER